MHLVLLPFSGGTLRANLGCNKPQKIVEGLKQGINERGIGVSYTHEELQLDNTNIDAAHKKIYTFAQKNNPSCYVGGDHSITYPLVKAAFEKERKTGLIIFDAHADVMPVFESITHDTYLRALIEQGFPSKSVFLIGIRELDPQELEFLKKNNIRYLTPWDISREGLHETSENIMAFARQFSQLYVSIDIDVLDPIYAPGTGYPEPNGLSLRELIYILQRLTFVNIHKIYDLVEVNALKDPGITIATAQKILRELT